jgi:hypothetical protein
LRGPLAQGAGDAEVLAMWLGQAAPWVTERPAAELVESLVAEAGRRLADLSPRA